MFLPKTGRVHGFASYAGFGARLLTLTALAVALGRCVLDVGPARPRPVARPPDRRVHEAVREALLPTLDQTTSTGLVTLPGAFGGVLFGGASPIEAAPFQLVVLTGVAPRDDPHRGRGDPARRPHALCGVTRALSPDGRPAGQLDRASRTLSIIAANGPVSA